MSELFATHTSSDVVDLIDSGSEDGYLGCTACSKEIKVGDRYVAMPESFSEENEGTYVASIVCEQCFHIGKEPKKQDNE